MTELRRARRLRRCFGVAALFFCSLLAQAADLADAGLIPHLPQAGRDDYQQNFLNAGAHRAFAIAPGGAWGWSSQQAGADAAIAAAVTACRKHTEQRCIPYAVDQSVVFDADAWSKLWRLGNDDAVGKIAEGVQRGQRFPNIAFKDPAGKRRTVAELNGKVVMLHFWGSWCPPCLRELPTLEIFHRILQDRLAGQVELVLLQVREPFADARAFIELQGWHGLPLSDSGASDTGHDYFDLADGGRIADRTLARVFPTTYVLDRRGVVLFAHTGPVEEWTQYLPLIEDVTRVDDQPGR